MTVPTGSAVKPARTRQYDPDTDDEHCFYREWDTCRSADALMGMGCDAIRAAATRYGRRGFVDLGTLTASSAVIWLRT